MIRDPANEVLVSLITLWEIVLKVRIGKLRLLLEELQHFMADQRIEQLPLTFDHLKALGELPSHHRDPFDHLLIAQAISEGLTLISADREFVDYPVRLVRC